MEASSDRIQYNLIISFSFFFFFLQNTSYLLLVTFFYESIKHYLKLRNTFKDIYTLFSETVRIIK